MRETLRVCGRAITILVPVLAIIHPLARLGASRSVLLDLVTHFQEPAFALSCLAAMLLARRRRRIAVAFLVLAVFQLEPLYRYSLPQDRLPSSGSSRGLRILVANVFVDNRDHEALATLIRRVDPDIVGLVEYSEKWAIAMRGLAPEYPYRIEEPRGFQGLALWFKTPPKLVRPAQKPTTGGWPYLHATIDLDGQDRHLWLLHPSTPFLRPPGDHSFEEFHAIARRIRAVGGSTIVMGDMNVTDGSPHFSAFLAEANLRDTRLGFGRQRSWPVDSPYRIAIDHILTSPDWFVKDRRREEPFGSDHFPLFIELVPSNFKASRAALTAEPSSSPKTP